MKCALKGFPLIYSAPLSNTEGRFPSPGLNRSANGELPELNLRFMFNGVGGNWSSVSSLARPVGLRSHFHFLIRLVSSSVK